MKLSSLYRSLALISIVAISALPANAKPLTGVYWPYASDISLEIENNRFREGAGIDSGAGQWQRLSNLKEIKRGVVYYPAKGAIKGMYYCHRSLFSARGGTHTCTKTGVK
jgi:hypothetical protein